MFSSFVPRDEEHSICGASFDELFNDFVDSDSCGLIDNATNRSASDMWDNYSGCPSSLEGSGLSILAAHAFDGPLPYRDPWGGSELSDHGCSSQLIDTEKLQRSTTHPEQSTSILYRKTRCSAHSRGHSLDLNKPLSGGVSKLVQRNSTSPRMSQPSASRKRMQSIWAHKIDARASRPDIDNTTQTCGPSPPLSATPQPALWNDQPLYPHRRTTMKRTQSYPPQSDLQNISIPAHAQFSPLGSPVIDDPVSSPGAYFSQSAGTAVYENSLSPSLFEWELNEMSLDYFGPGATPTSFTNTPPQEWLCGPGVIQEDLSPRLPFPAHGGLMIGCEPLGIPDVTSPTFISGGQPFPDPGLESQHMHMAANLSHFTFQGQPGSEHQLLQASATMSRPPTPPATPRSCRSSQGSSSYGGKQHHRSKTSNGVARSTTSSSAMGFVNYTPDDSKRILTGVAPSGSSKTKARREREAEDRRRRLSMAAAKAVMDAGGDVEELRQCGLLL